MANSVLVENPLLKQIEKLSPFIGHTPLFPVNKLNPNDRVKIFAKAEWQQFGGSVKARAAFRIIQDAVKRGDLDTHRHLLDATSGNTGIAYAHIAARLNIPVTLCIPENASEERKKLLKALGVHIKFTSPYGSTDEAQEMARELYESNPEKYYYADQYGNESNWKAHFYTTGPEIIEQTNGEITHFVAGLGTTGTFTGTGRRLNEFNDEIELIGLQPDIAMHGLEGWKHLETARVPDIYDDRLSDEIHRISTEKAYDTIKKAAQQEGLLLSPSSAANLAGALDLAEKIEEGIIVTVFPDDASKYGEVLDQLF